MIRVRHSEQLQYRVCASYFNVSFRDCVGSKAFALERCGQHTTEFRDHHTNTQVTPSEQAGTAVLGDHRRRAPLVRC
jgi:hypothetical protein